MDSRVFGSPAVERTAQLLLVAGFGSALFFTGTEGRLFFLSQLCLWLFLLVRLAGASGRLLLPGTLFSVFLVAFAGLSLSTLFWTPVAGYTQSMLWRQGSLPLVFGALLLAPRKTSWRGMRAGVSLVALGIAGVAIAQYLLGRQPDATFLNKNSLAGFLMPVLFWALYQRRPQRARDVWLARALLFCGGLVLGLIGSRGALLAMAAGMAVLLLLAGYARLNPWFWWRRGLVLGAGLMSSLLITGLEVGGGLGRLGTLQDPWSAGSSRFVIWQASWEMLRDSPWYGRGVGIYGLAYPQYRLATDQSAGHFAHNDLLQIAIETGWPGALLSLLIVLSATALILRGLRRSDMPDAHKRESLLLFSGIAAVLVHSLFTFHLYVYVTLLVIAVAMARWYLLLPRSVAPLKRIDLSGYGRWVQYSPVALCLVPLFWLMTGGMSQSATQRALKEVAADKTGLAVTYLQKAQRWWPSNDFNWYMAGEVIRLGLRNDQAHASDRHESAFSLARDSFEAALRLNPLRAAAPHKFALLLMDNGHLLSEAEKERVLPLLISALRIDPRYFPARIDLARSYESAGAHDRARQVLEAGLQEHYRNAPALIPYLQLAADYRLADRDAQGADELRRRIRAIRDRWGQRGG